MTDPQSYVGKWFMPKPHINAPSSASVEVVGVSPPPADMLAVRVREGVNQAVYRPALIRMADLKKNFSEVIGGKVQK